MITGTSFIDSSADKDAVNQRSCEVIRRSVMVPLGPPEVMREVQVHTLNLETQDSTLCASQPNSIHTFFQVESTIEEELSEQLQKQQSACQCWQVVNHSVSSTT